MRPTVSLLAAFILAVAVPSYAQHGQHSQQSPPESATVEFGILQTIPIGGLSTLCSQAPPFGGPTDPCAYRIHALFPDHVTVAKGGEVSFNIHGGGHGFAIYKVSKHTTRNDIGQQLCEGTDPSQIPPAAADSHNCNSPLGRGAAAQTAREVTDAKDDVVLVVPANDGVFPNNRVWSPAGRLMSANAHNFLNGGTNPPGPAPNGEVLTYRFLKAGRYLVLCANRSHFFNDWMFGFVDVEGDDNDKD
jgi:hypothetical protein